VQGDDGCKTCVFVVYIHYTIIVVVVGHHPSQSRDIGHHPSQSRDIAQLLSHHITSRVLSARESKSSQ